MILSPLAEVARAVRVGDLTAAEKALDRLDDYGGAVARGRAEARRDPPLPPLPVDSIAMIAEEKAGPPKLWRTKPRKRRKKCAA